MKIKLLKSLRRRAEGEYVVIQKPSKEFYIGMSCIATYEPLNDLLYTDFKEAKRVCDALRREHLLALLHSEYESSRVPKLKIVY